MGYSQRTLLGQYGSFAEDSILGVGLREGLYLGVVLVSIASEYDALDIESAGAVDEGTEQKVVQVGSVIACVGGILVLPPYVLLTETYGTALPGFLFVFVPGFIAGRVVYSAARQRPRLDELMIACLLSGIWGILLSVFLGMLSVAAVSLWCFLGVWSAFLAFTSKAASDIRQMDGDRKI